MDLFDFAICFAISLVTLEFYYDHYKQKNQKRYGR